MKDLSQPRLLTLKFAATCRRCSRYIPAGETADWYGKEGGVQCYEPCEPAPAPAPAPPHWFSERAEARDARAATAVDILAPYLAAPAPTYVSGDGIEIKAWLARALAEEFNVRVDGGEPIAFRNLELVEVLAESWKAVHVRYRYVSKICNSCHVCGKELDTEISRACGIGPVCAKRLGFPRAKLKDAQAILAKMEELAARVGEIGPRWIPRSQIVRKFRVKEEL